MGLGNGIGFSYLAARKAFPNIPSLPPPAAKPNKTTQDVAQLAQQVLPSAPELSLPHWNDLKVAISSLKECQQTITTTQDGKKQRAVTLPEQNEWQIRHTALRAIAGNCLLSINPADLNSEQKQQFVRHSVFVITSFTGIRIKSTEPITTRSYLEYIAKEILPIFRKARELAPDSPLLLPAYKGLIKLGLRANSPGLIAENGNKFLTGIATYFGRKSDKYTHLRDSLIPYIVKFIHRWAHPDKISIQSLNQIVAEWQKREPSRQEAVEDFCYIFGLALYQSGVITTCDQFSLVGNTQSNPWLEKALHGLLDELDSAKASVQIAAV